MPERKMIKVWYCWHHNRYYRTMRHFNPALHGFRGCKPLGPSWECSVCGQDYNKKGWALKHVCKDQLGDDLEIGGISE